MPRNPDEWTKIDVKRDLSQAFNRMAADLNIKKYEAVEKALKKSFPEYIN